MKGQIRKRKFVFLSVLAASVVVIIFWWNWTIARGENEAAFARHVLQPVPSSVKIANYWRPVGVGGDGLGVLVFEISRADLNALLLPKLSNETTVILAEEGVLLRLAILDVEERTRRPFAITNHGPLVSSFEDGFYKRMLADTHDPATVVFWYSRHPLRWWQSP